MNMAQVRKYQNAAGSLPKKKWNYKGKDYEVDDEELKMLNDWNMSNYEFDTTLPEKYDGIPNSKDVLAKKLGLISEDQYNAKYNPTETIEGAIKIENAPKKLAGLRYFKNNIEQDTNKFLQHATSKSLTDLGLILQKYKDKNYDIHYGGANAFSVIDRDTNKDITQSLFPNIKANPNDSDAKRNWGAFFNSKQHRYREDIQRIFGEFNEEKPYEGLSVRRGSVAFNYNKDADGNSIYDTNSEINQNNEQTIREIMKYVTDNKYNSNAENKYWSKYGTQLSNLKELYDEWGNNPNAADDLIKAVRSGKELTDSQKQILNWMGWDQFNPNATTDMEIDPNGNIKYAQASDIFGGNNAGDALKRLGKVTIDENGNYIIDSDSEFSKGAWDLTGIPGFENLKYTLAYNGRLYKDFNDLDTVGKEIFTPYFSYSNDAQDYANYMAGRESSGVRFYGDMPWQTAHGQDGYVFSPYSIDTGYINGLTEYLRNRGLANDHTVGVRDLRGVYNLPSEMRAYAILNGANSYRTTTQAEKPIYIAFDNNGKIVSFDPKQYSANLVTQNVGPIRGSKWDENTGRALIKQIISDAGNYNIEMDKAGNYWVSANGINRNSESDPFARLNPAYSNFVQDLINGTLTINNYNDLKDKYGNYANFNKFWDSLALPKQAAKEVRVNTNANKPYIGSRQSILKEGGKINWNRLAKLQEGGTATKFEFTDQDRGENAIGKAHTLGNYRNDEELLVGAAIGDLIGTIASIAAPSATGGIAGATIGIGSNIARAKAEKIQGKSFGERAKNFAINSAFDIAALPLSFTQFGDDIVKIAKLKKVIKSVGQPLIKYLGYMGFGSNVINTVSKIANGEDYTSEDLTGMIQGLASGITSGKLSVEKFGRAKLAGQLDAVRVKGLDNNVNKNITASVTRDGKEIKFLDKSPDEIAKIINNAKGDPKKAVEAIKNIASETKVGNETLKLTDDEASAALKKFATFGTKKEGWSKLNPFSKGTETVSYTKPTKEEAKGTAHYFFNARDRHAALGGRQIRTNQENLLGYVTPEMYSKMTGNIGITAFGSPTNRALAVASTSKPDKFNLDFDKNVNTVRGVSYRHLKPMPEPAPFKISTESTPPVLPEPKPIKAKVVDPMRPTGKRGQKKRGNKGKGKKKLEFGGFIPRFQIPAGSLPGNVDKIRDTMRNLVPTFGDLTKMGIVMGTNIASNNALQKGIDAQKRVQILAPHKSRLVENYADEQRALAAANEALYQNGPMNTSDLFMNKAFEQDRARQAAALAYNINSNISKKAYQYQTANAERDDFNDASEKEAAMKRSQNWTNAEMAGAQHKANLITQIGTAAQDFVANQNQRFANNLANYNAYKLQLANKDRIKSIESDPDNARKYNQQYANRLLLGYKNGGKTHTAEKQMAIDAARSNQKNIQKLNDSLSKMLIKLMK